MGKKTTVAISHSDADLGRPAEYTRDQLDLVKAMIQLVKEQHPSRIQIGERCAMGGDTMNAMEVCGIVDVANRTGVELCPFERAEFDMYKIDRPISFNEFPVPRPVREADVYIGLPKMKVHVHTTFTGAMKLQFGNIPDYDWMDRCHRDDIYQKIVHLTRSRSIPSAKRSWTWITLVPMYRARFSAPLKVSARTGWTRSSCSARRSI